MTRNPNLRMDVDTNWPYHRKIRALQLQHPETWPVYWAAYMALLAEAWRSGNREVTLEEAWCPAIPCPPINALTALKGAKVVDRHGRIPQESWDEWYGRLEARRSQAVDAANARWHPTSEEGGETAQSSSNADSSAPAMRPHNGSTAAGLLAAMPIPNQYIPSNNYPLPPRGGGGRGGKRRNGTNPRANGSSPRQIAQALAEERQRQLQALHMAYLRGELTEEQHTQRRAEVLQGGH